MAPDPGGMLHGMLGSERLPGVCRDQVTSPAVPHIADLLHLLPERRLCCQNRKMLTPFAGLSVSFLCVNLVFQGSCVFMSPRIVQDLRMTKKLVLEMQRRGKSSEIWLTCKCVYVLTIREIQKSFFKAKKLILWIPSKNDVLWVSHRSMGTLANHNLTQAFFWIHCFYFCKSCHGSITSMILSRYRGVKKCTHTQKHKEKQHESSEINRGGK